MAEYKKSRTPYYLKYDDYDNFLYGVEKYHDDHGGDADFYPHWAILGPLVTAFHAGYQAFVAARQLIDDTKRTFDDVVKVLRENMVGLRRQLPILIRDDSVLGHFGIEEEVPTDVDLLLVNARICRDYWESLCTPDPPPEYLALSDKLNENTALLASAEDAQRAYADAIRGREEARVVRDEAREACNAEERSMFAWYRGIWTDAKDDRWSATPWGASSGGGEEPGGGTSWRDKPVATMKIVTNPMHGIILGCEEYSGTERFDMRVASALAGEIAPPIPEEDYASDVEEPVFLGIEYFPGYVYYGWIRARKEGEVSEWSEFASVEWTG